FLVHEVCAQSGQSALREARETFVQQGRDGTVEDGVAEKFEAFVVGRAVAAVGQRLAQETGVAELVTEPGQKLRVRHARAPGRVARLDQCFPSSLPRNRGRR